MAKYGRQFTENKSSNAEINSVGQNPTKPNFPLDATQPNKLLTLLRHVHYKVIQEIAPTHIKFTQLC